MLKEFKDVRQVAGERRRRYWSDTTFELFVWFEPKGAPWGFELRYKLEPQQPFSGVRWNPVERFTSGLIDTGSVDGLNYNVGMHFNGACAPFPPSAVARFERDAGAIDANVHKFVRAKLVEFSRLFSPD